MGSPSKQVRIGLIGLGAFGKKLIKPIRYLHSEEDIKVVAVCDISPQIAKDFATEFEINNWVTDYKQLISNPDINLVYIATPPATHKDIALFALNNHKHVLCEKPLANSIDEAKTLMEASKKSNVVNALHFHLNYSPVLSKFSQLVKEGYIGDTRRISIIMHYPTWAPEWQKNAWIETREQGGFLLEQGVHLIQAVQKVFGKIATVESELQYPTDKTKCETGIIAKMKLVDGTPILIDGMSHVPGEERVELTVYGTKGVLTIKNWRTLLGGQTGQEIAKIPTEHPSFNPWIMKHVLNAIRGQVAEIYDFTKGYETQVVLEALRNPKDDTKIGLV